ncbi:MAG TPA: hypothetical protein DDY72_04975 [Verrucomicrobia bacterium]|nr:hypothetical protein [Verrucomicrobiota bacterium]
MNNSTLSDKDAIIDIARKMDRLDLWKLTAAFNWAIKPYGSPFPYFCTTMLSDTSPVRVRFVLLEGWQTMHDFVRMRMDPEFGYYISWIELPQFEIAYARKDDLIVPSRHNPGYLPWFLTPKQEGLVRRMLWEAYGVMLRLEGDHTLVLKHAEDRALFARVETAPGVWQDEPLEIPEPPPYEERVPVPLDLIVQAKSLPIRPDLKVAVDLRFSLDHESKDIPPRVQYSMRVVNLGTRKRIVDDATFVDPLRGGLKNIWLEMPGQLLRRFVEKKVLPCEIQVESARVFRFLRPVFLELPVKLTKLEDIPPLDACFEE